MTAPFRRHMGEGYCKPLRGRCLRRFQPSSCAGMRPFSRRNPCGARVYDACSRPGAQGGETLKPLAGHRLMMITAIPARLGGTPGILKMPAGYGPIICPGRFSNSAGGGKRDNFIQIAHKNRGGSLFPAAANWKISRFLASGRGNFPVFSEQSVNFFTVYLAIPPRILYNQDIRGLICFLWKAGPRALPAPGARGARKG